MTVTLVELLVTLVLIALGLLSIVQLVEAIDQEVAFAGQERRIRREQALARYDAAVTEAERRARRAKERSK